MGETYRVMAHAMDNRELDAAENILQGAKERTDAYVLGAANADQIAALKANGLLVQVLATLNPEGRPPLRSVETPGAGSLPVPNRARPMSYSTEAFALPDEEIDLSRANAYLLQIDGPLLDDRRQRLDALGVELLERYGRGVYSVFLGEDQATDVRALDFVVALTLYDSRQTAPGTASGLQALGTPAAPSDARSMVTWDVRLHRESDRATVEDWMRAEHVSIGGSSGRRIRVHLIQGSVLAGRIAGLPEVQRLEQFVPPKFFNDRARDIMRIDGPAGARLLPFDGSEELIAIADTGLDQTHPDFSGRIVGVVALGRPGQSDDPDGHGTHVAGSALGDGSASNGAHRGTAPAAKVYFQSLLDSHGGLGGLPLNLGDLFEQAYQEGARVHNNSWGAETQSTYTVNSEEVDEFVHRRRDMLIVFAAGNEGKGASPVNANPGSIDWLSLGSPATAKNALTVGASRSDRSHGGLSHLSWSQFSSEFVHPPISTDKISGNPECLAAFSSRGPCDDRRIKPDLVAPGTDIISAKSGNAPFRNFWSMVQGSPQYAYNGGTSMAAPLVTGCAAVVRQYYREQHQHLPSAALIRATLVNGARWLSGHDANASNPPPSTPAGNFDQGFGRVDMAASLPNPANLGLGLTFADNWESPADHFTGSGQKRRFSIRVVDATQPLRVCLAYTDAPGRSLQNNLNLLVQLPANGGKLAGNAQMRHSLNILDVDNNVEVVRLAVPAVGTFIIQISAVNLLRPPQDFALVVTGGLHPAGLQFLGN